MKPMVFAQILDFIAEGGPVVVDNPMVRGWM
jgi:hypothetical protein